MPMAWDASGIRSPWLGIPDLSCAYSWEYLSCHRTKLTLGWQPDHTVDTYVAWENSQQTNVQADFDYKLLAGDHRLRMLMLLKDNASRFVDSGFFL